MQTKVSFVNNKNQAVDIIVRPNNDGWCIWYLEMQVAGDEQDLPADFEHVFGNIDLGADQDIKLFKRAEQEALNEAARLETYLRK